MLNAYGGRVAEGLISRPFVDRIRCENGQSRDDDRECRTYGSKAMFESVVFVIGANVSRVDSCFDWGDDLARVPRRSVGLAEALFSLIPRAWSAYEWHQRVHPGMPLVLNHSPTTTSHLHTPHPPGSSGGHTRSQVYPGSQKRTISQHTRHDHNTHTISGDRTSLSTWRPCWAAAAAETEAWEGFQ